MHVHFCPVEITAALLMLQHGIPYVQYVLLPQLKRNWLNE